MNKNIVRFDVSVANAILMQVLHNDQKLLDCFLDELLLVQLSWAFRLLLEYEVFQGDTLN